MPIAAAAIGWSRIAISARPLRLLTRFAAPTNITNSTASVK